MPFGRALRDGSEFMNGGFEYRSSHRRCSVKKGVLRNFAKLTGKHLCQRLFFNKAFFIIKETLAQVFSCEFCEISKNTFFTEHPRTSASMSNFEGNQIFKNHYMEENKLSETSFNIKRNVSLIQNLDNFVCYTSVACDWQGIISRSTPPKAAELSLVVHRMTAVKRVLSCFIERGPAFLAQMFLNK